MNYGLFAIVFGCGLVLTFFVAIVAGPEMLTPAAICYLAAIYVTMQRGADKEKDGGDGAQTESCEED